MPRRVNKDNWCELRSQGFVCLTSIGNAGDFETEKSDLHYINDLRQRYGDDNVLVGDAFNDATGLPDAELSEREQIVGVYVKSL